MPYICSHTKLAFQVRYFIEIAYKGTNYHGWQFQPNAVTVQELINKAFSLILKKTINVVGAGRTDAGVHAEQLYAHLDLEEQFNIDEITYKLNSLLPNDIVILHILKVTDDAHARFNAESRSYQYRIYFGKNPFLTDTTWQIINKKLNVDLMNEAAEILLTYTNFKCFSRSNTDVKTYNCDIMQAKWIVKNDELHFVIKADRFLRNMVRAIVGTMINIGIGKMGVEELHDIIDSKSRSEAGYSVPAQALYLIEVEYPEDLKI